MKQLKLLFMFFALFAGLSPAMAADELTIYDGSTKNQYIPTYGYYADTNGQLSEFIIPAADLGEIAGATISALKFYSSSTTVSWGNARYKVYVKEVADGALDSGFSTDAGATTVYEGSLSITSGEMAITFANEYQYNGGNLLVGIYVSTKGTYERAYFYGQDGQNGFDNIYSRYRGTSSGDGTSQYFLPKTTITYESSAEGPAFKVKGYKTGDSYAFGLVNSGTTTTFTLTNPGTEAVTVNIAATGGYTVDAATLTIDAKGEGTVNVAVPENTGAAEGTVTFTPAATGLEAVTVNLTATVKDPNKLFVDFEGGVLPENWTAVGNSSYSSTYNWAFREDNTGKGYAEYTGSSTAPGTLTSPLMQFEDGEQFMFKSARTSSFSNGGVTLQISANGTDWTNFPTITDDVYGTWTTHTATIPATTKYIRFSVYNTYLTDIYGGELPYVADMKVTASSYDFSMIAEETGTTFKIKNAGRAPLTGISVSPTNNAYAVEGVPATLNYGEEAEVTVKLTTAIKGRQTGQVTVSAPEQTTVTFDVDGYVADTDLFYEDFNAGTLPDLWKKEDTRSSDTYWRFSNGRVAGSYNSNYKSYLITPSLTVAEGESLVFQGYKTAYGSATLNITMSKDGGEYVNLKSIPMTDDVEYYTIDGLEPGNYKFRFESDALVLDNFNGFHLNDNAPEMTVSPTTAANFGTKVKEQPEAITYTVTNTGTGTLDVEISSSDDTQFTVNPGSLHLGQGESSTFDINLVFDENYGGKTATITLHPTTGNLADATIEAVAITMDPTAWDVDFNDGKIPDDMADGPTWSYLSSYGQCAKASEATTTSKLVSPKLVVAEGESLTFEAEYSGGSGSKYLNVLYSSDRVNWTTAREITDLAFSYNTYIIDNIPAGEWYVAFEGRLAEIDNINGYHKVAMDYDVATISQDLPTEGMINSELTGSITCKNLKNALTADDYTAELIVDGIAIDELPTVDLATGEKKTFNFAYTPTEPYLVGTHQLSVRIKVGNYTFETAKAELTIKAEVATADIVVGTFDNTEMQGAPLPMTSSGNLHGATASIYKAADLGLSVGSKINRIAYYGYYYGSYTYQNVKAYLANTTDEELAEPYDATAVDGMTLIYDGSITAHPNASKTLPDESFSIELDNPFVYTGDNLKVVFVVETTGACTPYFTGDASLGTAITGVGATADELTYTTVSNPVLYLNVEKLPVLVTGTVTDKDGGAPVAGAKVQAESDNVKYTALTNATGEYTLSIVKNELTYDFTVEANGFLPYSEEALTFNQNTTKNVELQEAKGLYIANSNIPAEGIQNNVYTVSANVQNFESRTLTATARLYVDGEVVAISDATSIAAGETKAFTLSFTPHAIGEKPVYIEVAWDNSTTTTAEKTVDFQAEIAEGETTVATKTTERTSGYSYRTAPVDPYYENSMSETVYTAEELEAAGIAAGTSLLKLTYKGKNNDKALTSNMKVWMQNTSETSGSAGPKDEYTLVFDGENTIQKDVEEILVFDLNQPFLYTGQNLRIIVAAENQNGYSNSGISFDMDGNGSCYRKANDTYNTYQSTSMTKLLFKPVLTVKYDASAKVEGVVTDATTGDAISGATVTIASGDVQYEGTTDASGTFTVSVAQKTLDYTITVSAEGYDSYTNDIDLDGDALEIQLTGGSEPQTVVFDETVAMETRPSGVVSTVEVKYTTKAGWNTICMPFALAADDMKALFGEDYKAYELAAYTNGTLSFNTVTTFAVGKPYMVYTAQPAADSETYTLTNVDCTPTPGSDTFGGITIQGTFDPIEAPDMEGKYGIVPATGRIQKGSATASLKGYRAYFDIPADVDPASLSFSFDDGTVITGIDNLRTVFGEKGAIYDLQGRKVADEGQNVRLPKGVYIQNGRKVTIK